MTQICINKMCFEFSIYHFIFLFLLIILCNLVLNSFKSRKQRLTENLWNINYDIPHNGVMTKFIVYIDYIFSNIGKK
jgi:hypothetical protein